MICIAWWVPVVAVVVLLVAAIAYRIWFWWSVAQGW